MTAPTSRRTFLASAATAPAAPTLLATDATASAEIPIQRLFREREEVMDRSDAERLSEEEVDALNKVRWPIERVIAAEPVTDLRDLVIKVPVISGVRYFGLDDSVTLEWRCCTTAWPVLT